MVIEFHNKSLILFPSFLYGMKEFLENHPDTLVTIKVAAEITKKCGYTNSSEALAQLHKDMQEALDDDSNGEENNYQTMVYIVNRSRQLRKKANKAGMVYYDRVDLLWNKLECYVSDKDDKSVYLERNVFGLCYKHSPKKIREMYDEIEKYIESYSENNLKRMKDKAERLASELAKMNKAIRQAKQSKITKNK